MRVRHTAARLLTLAALLLAALAPSPAAAAGGAEPDYDAMLALAKTEPSIADVGKLRMAFAASPGYQPYTYGFPAKQIGPLVQQRDWTGVLAAAREHLDKNYLQMWAHFYAAAAYDRLSDAPQAAYHRVWFQRLHRSILDSGDGKTPKTAYVVIDVSEAYDVLSLMKVRRESVALVRDGGRVFDRFIVRPEQGEPFTLFFDVTLPMSRSPFGKAPRS